jgi:hypothetical protein
MTEQTLRYLTALAPARSMIHGRGSFLRHLYGVHQILLAWGCPSAVCRAGLFHSAYGTEFYGGTLFDLDDRTKLQNLIGPDSEALVYAFCRVSRSQLLNASAGALDNGRQLVPHEQMAALRSIEMANLLDQKAATGPFAGLFVRRLWQLARLGTALDERHPIMGIDDFPPSREHEIVEDYRKALELPLGDTEAASMLLGRCTIGRPVLSEPLILLAAIRLDSGDWAGAMSIAGQARDLLVRWASPWDKRLGFSDWLRLTDRICELADIGVQDLGLWSQLRSLLSARDLTG